MKKVLLLLAVVAGFVTVSCGSAEKDLKTLESKQWKLLTLVGVDDVIMPEEDSYTLSFTQKDGRFFGKANCNRYFGTYSSEGEYTMVFSKPGATMMMCQNDNAEHEFLSILDKVASFGINAGNLELINDKGVVLAVFEAQEVLPVATETEDEHNHSGSCNH